jgi:hypothetical protein
MQAGQETETEQAGRHREKKVEPESNEPIKVLLVPFQFKSTMSID